MAIDRLRLKNRPYPQSMSIVLPLFNEEEMLPLLRDRLGSLLSSFECPVQVIVVDDGSHDGTLGGLLAWAKEDTRVLVLALTRNFGHQAAATAGLDHAAGDVIVLMDADLQDPPELIHEMIDQYRSGYDVVYARRIGRIGETRFKRWTAWMFYRVMKTMVYKDLPPDTGDYRLISSECLQALKEMREMHRFLRGMVAWLGYSQTAVPFVRPPRPAGETKYPFSKMLRFAWTAIVSFSPMPLRLTFGLSFIVAAIGVGAGVYALICLLMGWPVVRGWTSLMLTICLIGSSILLSLGVVGEYVAKIYEESKGRPLYLVNKQLSYMRPE